MEDEMKQVLSAMRSEFRKVHSELASLRESHRELSGLTRRTAVQVAKLAGGVSDIKHVMATKDDISGVHSALDAFLPEIEASRRERLARSDAYMFHQDRLDGHERRLSRLEGRRA
jgi:hypothetical protein